MAGPRRWKPFLCAFDSIDAAIEAADPDLCRDDFRRARGAIVGMICDAKDDAQAELLCGVLDDVMAEALETLRLVPAMANLLASTDLAEAVGALRNHHSERVRLLASGIMSAWKATVQDDIAKAQAVLEKLDKMPQPETTVKPPIKTSEPAAKKTATDSARTGKITQQPLPKNRAPVAGSDRVKTSHTDARTKVTDKTPPAAAILRSGLAVRPCSDQDKMPQPEKTAKPPIKTSEPAAKKTATDRARTEKIAQQPLPKNSAPVAGSDRVKASHTDARTKATDKTPPAATILHSDLAVRPCSDQDKMATTKRKLLQSYQEAQDTKRQRMIQVIEAPEITKQRQRPIMRERGRERCGSSMVRSLKFARPV